MKLKIKPLTGGVCLTSVDTASRTFSKMVTAISGSALVIGGGCQAFKGESICCECFLWRRDEAFGCYRKMHTYILSNSTLPTGRNTRESSLPGYLRKTGVALNLHVIPADCRFVASGVAEGEACTGIQKNYRLLWLETLSIDPVWSNQRSGLMKFENVDGENCHAAERCAQRRPDGSFSPQSWGGIPADTHPSLKSPPPPPGVGESQGTQKRVQFL